MKILFPASSNAPQEPPVTSAPPIAAAPDIQPLRDALQALKKDLHEWQQQTGTSIGALKQAVQALEERLSASEKLPLPPTLVSVKVPEEPPKKTFNPDLERLRQSLSGAVSPAKGNIFSKLWTYLNESDAKVPARRP